MKEQTFKAIVDSIPEVVAFIDVQLEALDCPMKAQMQLDVAADEVFANISNYSGATEATVRFEFDGASRMVSVIFTDNGVPFDPMTVAEPDVTLPAEERQIGGLGIFLVRKTMDDVAYRRENDRNVLTIRKAI